MTFFCPHCWKEIRKEHRICPYCGADIKDYEKKDFEEKLINALRHPERETVQRAVWILGRLRSERAVEPLKELFNSTDNPFLKRQILVALSEIGSEMAKTLIRDCINSETGIVKKKAVELIKNLEI